MWFTTVWILIFFIRKVKVMSKNGYCGWCEKPLVNSEYGSCCSLNCLEKRRECVRRWRKANPERERANNRKQYYKDAEKTRAYKRAWDKAHPEVRKAYNKKWRGKYPNYWKEYDTKFHEQAKLRQRKYGRKIKLTIVNHYSQGTMRCKKCGFSDIRALQIDHIDGGGSKHHKELDRSKSGRLYKWIIKNNFPSGFQILCANCNWIK